MKDTHPKPLPLGGEAIPSADPVPLEVQEAYRMYHEGYLSSVEDYKEVVYG